MSSGQRVRVTMGKETKQRVFDFFLSFDDGFDILWERVGRWDKIIAFLLDNVEVKK